MPTGERPRCRRAGGRGFTLIELVVVLAIVALLASIAAPRYVASVERAREAALRSTLATLRDAIDQFAADQGRYPDGLDELVRRHYLRALPPDPVAREPGSWLQIRPPPGAPYPGRLYDVRSGAAGRGQDGRLYAEW